MNTQRLRPVVAAAVLGALLLASPRIVAQAPGDASPDSATDRVLHSCVGGGPALDMAAAEYRTLLDDGDRQAFLMAALQRWPVLARDGVPLGPVLLMGRGSDTGHWVFASLALGEDSATPCFTAVFSGGVFDFTPALIHKYFSHWQRS